MTNHQPRKPLAASDRLGVYKRLSDVPDRHRFDQYAAAYADRDVWGEFCEAHEYARSGSREYRREVDLVGERWRSFMADRGRHPALATPEDVDAWCASLRESLSWARVFEHWVRVNRFYDWLQNHTEHPHRYNPALMAAANGKTAPVLWDIHMRRTRDKREKREHNK